MRFDLDPRRDGREVVPRHEIVNALLELDGFAAVARKVFWRKDRRIAWDDDCAVDVENDRDRGGAELGSRGENGDVVEDGLHSGGMVPIGSINLCTFAARGLKLRLQLVDLS